MTDWSAWIGREETRADRIEVGAYSRWLATLDRAAPEGDAVPQGYHWALCAPDAATATLGPDGHPQRASAGAAMAKLAPARASAARAVDLRNMDLSFGAISVSAS